MKKVVYLLITIVSFITLISCNTEILIPDSVENTEISEVRVNWGNGITRVSWRPPDTTEEIEYYVITFTNVDTQKNSKYIVDVAHQNELENGKQTVDISMKTGEYAVAVAIKRTDAAIPEANKQVDDIVSISTEAEPPSNVMNFQIISMIPLGSTDALTDLIWDSPSYTGLTTAGSPASIARYRIYIKGDDFTQDMLDSLLIKRDIPPTSLYYPQSTLDGNSIMLVLEAAGKTGNTTINITGVLPQEYTVEVFAQNSAGLWNTGTSITHTKSYFPDIQPREDEVDNTKQ